MAITYNNNVMGSLLTEDGKRIEIRQGNCLAVFIYPYKENKTWYHQLWNFYCDEQHIKNIIKSAGNMLLENVSHIRLNLYYKECKTLLKYITKDGYIVECYYKEP